MVGSGYFSGSGLGNFRSDQTNYWGVLGFYLLTKIPGVNSTEPVQQFNAAFHDMLPGWAALTLAVILVVISQIKINVTNAYSGSLAWTSAYTRISKHYPGRIVFVIVNLAIALALMEGNMFAVLGKILGFYSNFAIAWVVVVATDISINKYVLKLSPKNRNTAVTCSTT